MYVYLITNLVTGDTYVGKTIKNIEHRFSAHLYNARSGGNTNLYKAIKDHGEESFKVSLLEEIQGDLEDLNEREIFWIAKLNPSYNMTKGGDGGDTSFSEAFKNSRISHSINMRGKGNPFYGRKHSEETKKKISLKKIGSKLSAETKDKISKACKGRKPSKESIEKLSLLNSKIWFLICPDGNKIKVKNLAAFCREKNLDQRNMCNMYRGIYKTSKGYKRNYELDPIDN